MFRTRAVSLDAPLQGAPGSLLEQAATTLMAMGFEIEARAPDVLVARGPGWSSTRQPALLGASRLALTVGAERLRLEAELGGLAGLRRFVLLFPGGLATVLVVGQWLLTGRFEPWLLWVIVPWIFLSPVLAVTLDRRVDDALERFALSLAALGGA